MVPSRDAARRPWAYPPGNRGEEGAMGTSESRELMRRITEEIWNNGRIELVDELIAEGLVDHVDIPGVETTGRQRYYDSVVVSRTAFPDGRNPLDFIVADDDL